MEKIYTIGYSDKTFSRFVRILKQRNITQVVDVRHFPTSKWPEYEKENLQKNLSKQGISYTHLESLGGYRDQGYSEYIETEKFKKGLKKLINLAKKKSTAIMCLESYPSGCHRRFIARCLEERGWNIIHLVGKKGTCEDNENEQRSLPL